MDISNQSFKEHLLKLAWNIGTEPLLLREISLNPYASRVTKVMSQRFPEEKQADIIRAVIFAEPESRYDRNFNQLPRDQQAAALHQQKLITQKINKRLILYSKKHAKQLSKQSKEFIYDMLSFIVFQQTDVKEIENIYSQSQRQYFRLAIVHLIEDLERVNNTNQPKHSNFVQVNIVIGVVLFLAISYLVQNHVQDSIQDNTNQKQILSIEAPKKKQSIPVLLIAPSINVNAVIENVGITKDGSMDTPTNIYNVGWYNLGPLPGERGSAVISGHFDGTNGEAGVFNNLDKLKPGDKLHVVDSLGVTNHFIVRESRTYNPGYAEDVFLSKDTGRHLNLITCNGNWDLLKNSYNKRLVVFTDLVL